MRLNNLCVRTLAVVSLLLSPFAFAANIITLSSPAGSPFDRGHGAAISSDGSVVVGYMQNSTTGATQAFRWDRNTDPAFLSTGTDYVQLLSVTSGSTVFVSTTACCVSADGTVVYGSGMPFGSTTPIPLRWTIDSSGQSSLSILSNTYAGSVLRATSPDGSVAGGTGSNTAGAGYCSTTSSLPALWPSPGAVWDSATLPGNSNAGDINAIANAGSVVVGDLYNICNGAAATASEQAFVWTPTSGYTLLGLLPGATFSTATVVTPNGKYVAGNSGSSLSNQAFIWNATSGMTPLLAPLAGTITGPTTTGFVPSGITADGSVVVGNVASCDPLTAPWSAYNNDPCHNIWTAQTGVQSLWQLLIQNGVWGPGPPPTPQDPTLTSDGGPPFYGWFLDIDGISADGGWVVGTIEANDSPGGGTPSDPQAVVVYLGLNPPAPVDVQLLTASNTGIVTVSWKPVPNATSYFVLVNGSADYVTTGTSQVLANLTPGANYTIAVVTNSWEGQSNYSSFTPLTAPGNGQASVTWAPVSHATGYVVGVSTTPGAESANTSNCNGSCAVSFPSSATSGTITGLQNGTKYYVKVFATAPVGYPVESPEVTVTPAVATTTTSSSSSGSSVASSSGASTGTGGGGVVDLWLLAALMFGAMGRLVRRPAERRM